MLTVIKVLRGGCCIELLGCLMERTYHGLVRGLENGVGGVNSVSMNCCKS